jgi:hypothetical protein
MLELKEKILKKKFGEKIYDLIVSGTTNKTM